MGTALVLMLVSQLRLVTENGPVHVAIPLGRARVTVVYVHGFYTHVDDAWVHHRLARQLADSGLSDAVFIAPEAPAGPSERVYWTSLDALLAEVERQTATTLPRQVIAVGHSGGYRTLVSWAGSERLQAVALLDAFYGSADPWDQWLTQDPARRIYVLGRHTLARSRPFCERHRSRARCEASPVGHMEIVTSGLALPHALQSLVAAQAPDV